VGFCCAKCKVKFDKGGAVFRSKINNFSASKEFIIANKNRQDAQISMDEKIELIQQKLRIVSAEFQKMGPEINLGWEKPIATK
jgi:ribose 5-phosphate isomerase